MNYLPAVRQARSGFTIVELLVVIVIIGILAAITIVAYTGIQNRAKESALRSDLAIVAKKMASDNALAGSYALTAGAVDSGKGLPASGSGTTYQYQSTGSTYCITGTNGTMSFKISDAATSPNQGGCPGDGVGGASAVTNLAINPSGAVNANYWSTNNAGASIARDGTSTRPGSLTTGSIRTTFSATVSMSTQLWDGTATPLVPVVTNDSVTTSAWARSSVAGRTLRVAHRWRTSALAQVTEIASSPVALSTGWTQVSFTATAPANAVYDHISFYFDGQAADVWWLDDVMVTKGATSSNYADGSTPNWIWGGSPHNSTSTGPAV
ncbi:MAG: prepilin-type N-terminal cleavage/methylation domain-containing protein [Candidatus Saccharimonadales bacterium]